MMMPLRKTHVFLLVILGLSITGIGKLSAQEGQLVDVVVHSAALEGNLLEDSADRNVTIYLPPGYDENSGQRYPVIYLLHGYAGNNQVWTGRGYLGGLNVKSIADGLIEQGDIRPMIIVMPDGENKYWGSMYTNSSVTGNWEDFIVRDLVEYIDNTYRTLPKNGSRGIAGHSMGGYGTLKLAMKHPEVYSALYAMSPGPIVFETEMLIARKNDILAASRMESFGGKSFSNFWAKAMIGLAAAVAPNPDATPLMADFPFQEVDGEVQVIDEIWQRWLQHDPLIMLSTFGANLLQFREVYIDCGTSDDLIETNRIFSQGLTDANIPHVFTEYDGNHTNRIEQRVGTEVFPLFSNTLSFELEPTAVEKTTWGQVKAEVQE